MLTKYGLIDCGAEILSLRAIFKETMARGTELGSIIATAFVAGLLISGWLSNDEKDISLRKLKAKVGR